MHYSTPSILADLYDRTTWRRGLAKPHFKDRPPQYHVAHHEGERAAVRWACELMAPEARQTFAEASQSDSVVQRFDEQTGRADLVDNVHEVSPEDVASRTLAKMARRRRG